MDNGTPAILEEWEILMPHGRIPKDALKEVRALYNEDKNPELAGQLAIALIEYSLCGTTSFSGTIARELRPYKESLETNLNNYNVTCEMKIVDKRLEDIAKMYLHEKKSQQEIASIIGITQPEVSKRLKTIQRQYPELIEKYKT